MSYITIQFGAENADIKTNDLAASPLFDYSDIHIPEYKKNVEVSIEVDEGGTPLHIKTAWPSKLVTRPFLLTDGAISTITAPNGTVYDTFNQPTRTERMRYIYDLIVSVLNGELDPV